MRRAPFPLDREYGKEPAMRTYYRGPDALVTDERFVWRTSSPRIFSVPELRNVGLIRSRAADRRSSVAATGGFAAATLAGVAWLVVGPAVAMTIGFIAVVGV